LLTSGFGDIRGKGSTLKLDQILGAQRPGQPGWQGRLGSAPARRVALALLLIALVLFPASAASVASKSCRPGDCTVDGRLLWSRRLSGTWIAEGGVEGTVYAQGQAYAAVGGGVAAIGYGTTVAAYAEETGVPLWTTTLSEPVGSRIVAVDIWPGVITVGVEFPPDTAKDGQATPRQEIVLAESTGKQIRAYPADQSGGAVAAGRRRMVIVGHASVTSYANASGSIIWRDQTGPADQAWQVDSGVLYVTVSARGVLSSGPVTAVRRINLRTGAERLIEPPSESFDGELSGAADGILLFAGPSGLDFYRAATGELIARRPGISVVGSDPVRQVLYADTARALIGINPSTGENEPGTSVPGPLQTYGVRAGVALGLDPGAAGAAWGYSIARRHVIWTTRSLPWPHYFVDPAGLGGSADPAGDIVVLVICPSVGQATRPSSALTAGLTCRRPMFVAINR
jgi:hypothetical protein